MFNQKLLTMWSELRTKNNQQQTKWKLAASKLRLYIKHIHEFERQMDITKTEKLDKKEPNLTYRAERHILSN